MANKIKISGTLLAVNDNSVTDEGSSDGDYTNRNVDAHAQRRFGGKYNTLTTYTDEAIARFTNSVVAENNTTDGLDDNGWQEGASGPTSGTLPATIYAISVKYVSTLGTVANVFVAVKSTGEIRMANLALGESVALPIAGGLSQENILIGASAYVDGVHEATVNILVLGEGVELISHWIGDNESGGSIANEIGGKPALTVTLVDSNFWAGHIAWKQGSGAQSPNVVVGTISGSASNYSMIFALHTGSGYSFSLFQRLISAVNGSAVRFIDIIAWYKPEPNWSLWDAIGDNNHLADTDLEPNDTNTIFTLIFEDPDIIIYKNGALLGTLANAYTKNSLDGTLGLLSRDDGGTRGYLASSMAELKIFSGVIGGAQRIAAENAMATTYGVTF